MSKIDSIVDIGLEQFRINGYNNVNVKQICEKANISRATFYSYFSGKQDLILYKLKAIRSSLEMSVESFAVAANDFERMWIILEKFLDTFRCFGAKLGKTVWELELENAGDLFNFTNMFNAWFVQLVRNCQCQGIIQNQTDPEELVKIGIDLAIGTTVRWSIMDGGFDLNDVVRKCMEGIYDLKPEYRSKI